MSGASGTWWPTAAGLAAMEALEAEFKPLGWKIRAGLYGMVWSARWDAADGRQGRYIVAGSGPELLTKLRALTTSQGTA